MRQNEFVEHLSPRLVATAMSGAERRALIDLDGSARLDGAQPDSWRESWARSASRGRLTWASPEWDRLGLDRDRISRELADLEPDVVARDGMAPAWAQALDWFLAHLPEDPPAGTESAAVANSDSGSNAGPLYAVIASAYEAGLACLVELRGEGLLRDAWPASVDAPVATALAGRVASAQARGLQPEVIASRALGQSVLPGAPEDWIDRLQELPGLARPLGLAVASWRTEVIELAQRWVADRSLLTDDADNVVDVRLGLGDPHQGGRSVAMVRTAAGRTFCKPKPQGGPAAWQEFVAQLLDHPACRDAGIRAAVRPILGRDGYGWDSDVPRDEAGAVDAAGSRIWLRTFGALVRVCELLECRDMWLDNLITHDGVPQYIDVETVLQPRQQEGAVMDVLAETSLPTGAISLPIRLPDGTIEDIGVMRRPGVLALPFRREDLGDLTPIGEFGADGIMRWQPDPWRPEIDPSVSAVDEVLIGYDAVDEALEDTQLVSALEEHLRQLADEPSRVVLRSTFTCYSFMQDSLRPETLHDGRARDIALAALISPGVDALAQGASADEARWLVTLGIADALALGRLDVPLVRHDPRTGALTLDDGTIVAAPMGRTTALGRALDRLQHPSRHRALRRAVAAGLTEIALAAGDPDAAAQRSAAFTSIADALQEALESEGGSIDRSEVFAVLAGYGYGV